MFKFFIIISLLIPLSYADEKESATKIVKAMVNVINTSEQKIWIPEDDKNIFKLLNKGAFNITKKCENANLIILREKRLLAPKCMQKPLVILDYDLFNDYDNAVAAFFWKKGRPNIVFIKKRIEKFKITLPLSYEIYEEETIW